MVAEANDKARSYFEEVEGLKGRLALMAAPAQEPSPVDLATEEPSPVDLATEEPK